MVFCVIATIIINRQKPGRLDLNRQSGVQQDLILRKVAVCDLAGQPPKSEADRHSLMHTSHKAQFLNAFVPFTI